MTTRDFFILVIKLFGLFSLITSLFSTLPNNISLAFIAPNAFSIVWIIIVLSIIIWLFIWLIFKSDKVVSLLKLDKGFDSERIELGDIDPSAIVKIGIFIIGGLLIIDNIPLFLNHTFWAFKSHATGEINKNQNKFYWAISAINIVIGYLLLTNYDFIVKGLKIKRKNGLKKYPFTNSHTQKTNRQSSRYTSLKKQRTIIQPYKKFRKHTAKN